MNRRHMAARVACVSMAALLLAGCTGKVEGPQAILLPTPIPQPKMTPIPEPGLPANEPGEAPLK